MLKHSLIALAALGAGLVGLSATQASAFTAAPQPAIELNDNPLLTEVASAHHHRHHRYNNYYGNPWWGLGGVGLGFGLGYFCFL